MHIQASAHPADPDAIARYISVVTDCAATALGADPAETGPERCFSDLGLDSFGALRLRRAVAAVTGADLPLVEFLGDRTVRSVAAALAATAAAGPDRAPAASADAVLPGDAVPVPAGTDSAPLTPIQGAYWAGRESGLPLGGVATFWYHEYDRAAGDRVIPDQAADVDRLEEAWSRLVAHHPMLRATVGRDGVQRIAHEVPAYRIERTDLRTASPAETERVLADLRERLSHQVRRPESWPLFSLNAALLPDGRTRIFAGFDVLVLDFASWRLLMRQWGTLAANPGTELPSGDTQFLDLISHRASDPRERDRAGRDRRYWLDRLDELPPGPRLPLAADPAGIRAPRFRRRARRLDSATWSRLRAVAAAEGVSPSALVLAAFGQVLTRWGATVPFSINATLFDRPEGVPGVEHLVGDFTTTALLAMPEPGAAEGRGFTTYARDVNRVFWDAIDHRGFSGVEVARELSARARAAGGNDANGRSLLPTVTYPVVFTSGIGLAEGEPQRIGTEVFGVSQTPQVLLDHLAWEEPGPDPDRGQELILVWDAVQGAVPEMVAEGLADAELRLLAFLATGSSAWTVADLGWDPSFRRPEPLSADPFPGSGPLLDGPLREAAQRNPDTPALLAGGAPVSHAELRARADAIARHLTGLGVGRGDLVLVAVPKGPGQIAAVLGITRLGAGYVPVDPSWPAARIASVCQQAGIRHVLITDGVPVAVPGTVRATVIDPDGTPRADEPVPGASAAGRFERADANELAYVIFTSGSTGAPKGVAIEHRAARTTLDDITDRFGVTRDDRVLALSALSFDLSVYDVFGVLGAGGALVLPDPGRLRDPGHWLELIAEHGVTIWNTAPALLEMLVEYAEADPGQARQALRSLRLVMLSGDWIPVTLPGRLRALCPQARVMSLGGATEASIWSITYPVGDVDPAWASIPYGRPLHGQNFYILDEAGRPCPVGEAGELFIAGDGLARGYISDSRQTAERFSVHPVLGQRLYRTGDLGRWRADGAIEFLGRNDRQVKVRGHRIELGEIEAALSRIPQVRQAVVSAVPGPDERPRLVAHVSLAGHPGDAGKPHAEPPEAALASALREHVPDYMVPARFVILPELPVTENGKVDYKALPNPFRRRSAGMDTDRPPATAPTAAGPAAPLTPAPDPASRRRAPADGASADRGHATMTPRPEGLAQAVRRMLTPDVDESRSLVAAGATSLDVIRIANAIEDHTGSRPAFGDLLAFGSIASLLNAYATTRAVQPPASGDPVGAEETGTGDGSSTAPLPDARRRISLDLPEMLGLDLSLGVSLPPGEPLADGLVRAGRWLAELNGMLAGSAWEILGTSAGNGDGLLRVSLRPADPARLPSPMVPGPFPLTEMQLAYLVGRADGWLGDRVAPHYYTEVELTDLDVARLNKSLRGVIARHPMLRAVITPDVRQRLLDDPPIPEVEVIDLSGLAGARLDEALASERERRSHKVLDPVGWPLMHIAAIRLDSRRWRLCFGLDLLFCDAQSAALLAGELLAAYRSSSALRPPPATRFADWVAERAAAQESAPARRARDYWQRTAAVLPDGPALPIRPPGPGRVRFTRRRAVLRPGQWQALRGQAALRGLTPAGTLIAAFADVLRSAGAGDRFTLMLTTSDRPAGHAGVIGDYTSTMLLDASSMAVRVADRARDLQQRLWAGLEHSTGPAGVHGNEVLRQLTALRGRQVLLPVVFSSGLGSTATADGRPSDASELLSGFGRTEYAISQTPHVVLDVQAFEADGELRVNLDAVETAFPAGYLDTVFARYEQLLGALAGDAAWDLDKPPALLHGSLPVVGDGTLCVAPPGPMPDHTAPAGAASARIERSVARVMAELLGADPDELDTSRSFFELGLTSLTLVHAHNTLRREFGETLSVLDLFAFPSIRALAAEISRQGPSAAGPGPGPASPPVTSAPAGPAVPSGELPAGDMLLTTARRRGRLRRDSRAG
jgi:amino acid adenylation domain-containing protein